MNHKKYKAFPSIDFKERTWPNSTITKAPIWCSVDLRDGNQALPIPMGVEEKLALYKLLIKMGFKQIEVCFPSASETEFKFLRSLVKQNLIPDNVTIQVLTQAREHLIRRTFEAIKGIKNSIVYIYNSTSTLQRKVVFNKDKEAVKKIAIESVKLVKELAEEAATRGENVVLEYSPESFTGTELDYAVEVCDAILDVWQPTTEKKAIINLPSTVEMATPNVYADQIEWFAKHIKNRETILISLHAHNDRGTAVAATELGILAGADRVEGTLFGNDERTGNADILNVMVNMYSQGINPEIDIIDVNEIQRVYEETTKLTVHPRHPYVGELVHTAFSGSHHQDAINKGLKYLKDNNIEDIWEVPYLPIDPADLGRSYEAIIRINSQSGKGGVAFILEREYGFKIPKSMHPELGAMIKKATDESGSELSKEMIFDIFKREYIDVDGNLISKGYKINEETSDEDGTVTFTGTVSYKGKEEEIIGSGSGPLSAFLDAIKKIGLPDYTITAYEQHAREEGEDSQAITYVQIEIESTKSTNRKMFGIGISKNITSASLKAVINGINRSQK
ncbi:2-isopropylmalate synthase [endosymbiont 'TC1' of Trimyema compressum]|uniref:2-isopropylmalate synthase n=1 Tax=endosymbiont 'TC1' of Trimyema compressum TaxID=243899 RepID=UPI0007F113B3|nr:2-isopropylmalate synthase [endosymbiont 'TC1' of Trimyema compressum]AMP21408.1 2-isopropylmalate synthase [endosymbiont 'TC1' of Trimyema compressum]